MGRRRPAATAASLAAAVSLVALPGGGTAAAATTPRPMRTEAQTVVLGSFDQPTAGVRSIRDGPAHGQSLTLRRDRTGPFTAVAVTWAAAPRPADIALQVRSRRTAGWTTWRSAASEREGSPPAGERRSGTDLVWLGLSTGVEVRVSARAGRPTPGDLRLLLLDPGRSTADRRSAIARPSAAAMPAAQWAGTAPQPQIYTRADWGADESLMGWSPEYAPTIKAGFIHHSVQSNDYTPADTPAVIRADYYYHAVTRGWGDIGYNFVVDRFGRIWQGRSGDISRPGIAAHTGGFNYDTFGIAMLGDFSAPAGVTVPAAVQTALVDVFAWKLSMSGADPLGETQLTSSGGGTSAYPAGVVVTKPVVMGHRDVGATDCPGDYGYGVIPSIRTRVAALMAPAAPGRVASDFDGDGRSDAAVFRPSTGTWYVRGIAGATVFGRSGDVPLEADFAGEDRNVPAVYRPSTGVWYITGRAAVQFGDWGDLAVPADFTGDGRADPTVFRPTTGDWYTRGAPAVHWGQWGDIPVAADFTGAGRASVAVFRPANGMWYVSGMSAVAYGRAGDVPLARDFTGDGRADIAVFRPSTGVWYVRGLPPVPYGQAGDVPIAGDFDGDARADLSLFRPDTATWFVRGDAGFPYGQPGDRPITGGGGS